MYRILVINLGGTSGKLAVFEDEKCVSDFSFDYSKEETDLSCPAQEEVALKVRKIQEYLAGLGMTIDDIDVLAPRFGGMFYGGEGGTFRVEGDLEKNLNAMYVPDKPVTHATYATMEIVNELQKMAREKKPVLTTDPSTVNHVLPEARITGQPLFYRRVSFHALNHRAAARHAAQELGKPYNEVDLIVVHAGGGVSVGAHCHGRILDVNDSSGDGDGAFSTNRAGTLPTGQLVELCYSGKYTRKETMKLLKGNAGLLAYLGTDDLRVVEKRIEEGDEEAELIFNALAYQICREIGACFATLKCHCDGIVLTAGMAHSKRLVEKIKDRVGAIAPLFVFPGGFENEALAFGALRVLRGEEEPAVYEGEDKNIQAIM